MKHIPIALLAFAAPAFAEKLPINPAVTEATIAATICKPSWTKAVRPPIRDFQLEPGNEAKKLARIHYRECGDVRLRKDYKWAYSGGFTHEGNLPDLSKPRRIPLTSSRQRQLDAVSAGRGPML